VFIEIKGVQFVNKGAELMLHAILQQILQHIPSAKIVLEPGKNSTYIQRTQVRALQKFSFRKGQYDFNNLSYWLPKKLRNWLVNNYGVITEADIDIVLDASGFAYGDQWSSTKIKLLCGEVDRAAKHKKKFILLPQAFGPFSRQQDIANLKCDLAKATLIYAREDSSYKNLTNIIGEPENLIKSCDFTNLVTPIVDQNWQEIDNLMVVIPNYNMLSSRNADPGWQHSYVNLMVEAIKLAKKNGMKPIILNHEGQEDERVCCLIKEALGEEIDIVREDSSLKVKGIIAAAKLVVCSRFHGCVSALSQGIPCLGTSWSHKYERLFEEYELAQCLILPESTVDELTQKMQFAVLESLEKSEPNRLHFKSQAKEMWGQVFSAIK
jgi:polysaccharide pyruvyl transferase WcaK-like protein